MTVGCGRNRPLFLENAVSRSFGEAITATVSKRLKIYIGSNPLHNIFVILECSGLHARRRFRAAAAATD